MKVLVIGKGGREHALAWKLARSGQCEKLYAAPGNPGMAEVATLVPVADSDIDGLVAFAEQERIDLTVVGPEAPLAAGLADRLLDRGRKVFGPTQDAARLESSKIFCKELLQRHGIPTAHSASFTDVDEARAYIRDQGAPIVIKADGLAAGKGVLVCDTVDAALQALDSVMVQRAFGDAGAAVVIEECLTGPEVSVIGVSDGLRVVPLAPSQDHKRAGDGDTGLNTGGMGAYSPVPALTNGEFDGIVSGILQRTVDAMRAEGRPYVGALYAGLMLTAEGPKVLEFNCRFGDPETQVLLPRLNGDLLQLLNAAAEGDVTKAPVSVVADPCVTVVIASGGYPGAYEQGKMIRGLDAAADLDGVVVFHAGTKSTDQGIVTAGGRVLSVTACGSDFPTAIARAYDAVRMIHFDNCYYRTDIAQRALRATAECEREQR